MSDPKEIWLAPICHEGGDGRQWCQDDVWGDDCGCGIAEHQPARYVLATDHDRVAQDRDSWREQAERRLIDWDQMRQERDTLRAENERLRAAAVEHVFAVRSKRAHRDEVEALSAELQALKGGEVPDGITFDTQWPTIAAELPEHHRSAYTAGDVYAAECDAARAGWDSRAMLAAAPQPAQDVAGLESEGDIVGRLSRGSNDEVVFTVVGDPYITDGMPLYTAPQPTQDMTELVEALEALNALPRTSGHALPSSSQVRAEGLVIRAARVAVSAYRAKAGG